MADITRDVVSAAVTFHGVVELAPCRRKLCPLNFFRVAPLPLSRPHPPRCSRRGKPRPPHTPKSNYYGKNYFRPSEAFRTES